MSQPHKHDTLPTALIEKVLSQAQATASHSWEYGVVFEALLEYRDPAVTVFNAPVSRHQKYISDVDGRVEALSYIKPFFCTDNDMLCEGNGSSADSASLGIPVLLLNSTDTKGAYLSAAQRQVEHLLTAVPRLPNDAISHRDADASAWADFIYMVPPLLAYYGVYSDDGGMVREAMRQCRLYLVLLGSKRGPWMHIVSTGDSAPGERDDDDRGLWSTSNGWAAAGMARVLATVRGSRFAEQMQDEQSRLVEVIGAIVRGAMAFDTDASGLLRNYFDEKTWWCEVSGTALLAATVFRMAVLKPDIFGSKHTDWALQKMESVGGCISTENGVATPVVKPLKESQRESKNTI